MIRAVTATLLLAVTATAGMAVGILRLIKDTIWEDDECADS